MSKRIKVLYVEDSPSNRHLVKTILDDELFEYCETDNAISGISMAKEIIPDLILMDIRLMGLSGTEATIILKQIPELSHIPVIAVTAKTLEGDREKALVAGCSGYIPKPINARTFQKKLLEVYNGISEDLTPEERMTFLQQNQEEIVDHLEVEIRNLRKSERDLQVKILELENKNKELHETQKMLVHSEKLAMAGQLVAGVVHEIRTPLTGMMGYHHILKMKLKDEILLGYLENCVNAENKIKDIVSNMLNFAKRKNDLVGIINIQDVFSSIKGIIHILSKQESVKIELQIPETELNIACNPGGVEQVVMSLVNNAVYAVKKTELNKVMNPPIMISAHKDEAKKEIVIKVQDKGCGIHDEIQEKIFEPFFTTKSLEDGTGLGLSICKTIVESFHGRMELHSKINVGSTFYVVFPEARKQNGI